MAVATKQKTRPETLILDNGDELHIELIEVGFDVGRQEDFAQAIEEAPFHAKRAAKRLAVLNAALDEAIEQDLPDDEYEGRFQAVRDYKKTQEGFLHTVNLGILTMIASWDEALTKADEDAWIFVPLTMEGLATLNPMLRLDIFMKAMQKLSGRTEEEKKESSAKSNGDMPTPKALPEASPDSTPDIISPCDTDKTLMMSERGASPSTMKPS